MVHKKYLQMLAINILRKWVGAQKDSLSGTHCRKPQFCDVVRIVVRFADNTQRDLDLRSRSSHSAVLSFLICKIMMLVPRPE